MNSKLTASGNSDLTIRQIEALEAARRYAEQSRSESTWRTYETAWRIFSEWCDAIGLIALPAEPQTIAMFVGSEADKGLAESTISHRLAAIRLMHLGQGMPSPHNALAVVEVMRGLRRQRAREGSLPEKKSPMVDELIKQLVDNLDLDCLRGKRDRTLLLYGFAGALRRSELVAIDVTHIKEHEKGHILTIPFSKGDQEGKGQAIPILAQPNSPYCPIAAYQEWIKASKISKGAVFRRMFRGDKLSHNRLGDRAVAELVKDCIHKLKDPSLSFENFSAHSLRRGLLTSAAKENVNLFKLITQSRHSQVDTVLEYVDNTDPFDQHVAEHLLNRASTVSTYSHQIDQTHISHPLTKKNEQK